MPMQHIIRSYEAVVDDVKPSERSVISKIGGMAVDRHRSRITPAGIDLTHYRKNPIVLHEHGRCPTRGTLPVGRNQWIKIDGDRMIAKTFFRDDAYSDALFTAYRDDWMRGWSINVLAHEASAPTTDEVRAFPSLASDCDVVYRKTELVEYSTTSMPSHRDALTLMVERGIWVPDDVLAARQAWEKSTSTSVAIPRTATDSLGGQASGGVAIVPTRPDRRVMEKDGKWWVCAAGGEPISGPHASSEDAQNAALENRAAPVSESVIGADAKDQPARKEAREDEEEGEDKETFGAKDQNELPKDHGTHRGAERIIIRYITKDEDGRFTVHAEDGKHMGTYGSKAEAEKRLREIEYFKHEGRTAPTGPKPPEGPEAEPDDGNEPDENDDKKAGVTPPQTVPKSLGSGEDPVQHDGHGGWTVRGVEETFPDEALARRRWEAMQAPPRAVGDILRSLDSQGDERNRLILEELRSAWELEFLGRV